MSVHTVGGAVGVKVLVGVSVVGGTEGAPVGDSVDEKLGLLVGVSVSSLKVMSNVPLAS